jgi:hypothetical protein
METIALVFKGATSMRLKQVNAVVNHTLQAVLKDSQDQNLPQIVTNTPAGLLPYSPA